MIPIEDLKKRAGYLAATFVRPHMILGLGTGSTVKYFIEALIKREKEESLQVGVVSSSLHSLDLATQGGLRLLDINTIDSIDLTVDGADEIDPEKRMIKGGGGALLREKILATLSQEMVVIVDETKQVPLLGRGKIPVEIVPFAHKTILHTIQKKFPHSALRMKTDSVQELYLTDNGNYIVDIHLPAPTNNPEKTDRELKEIPGIVETGFFFHLAGRVIVAYSDGQVVVLH